MLTALLVASAFANPDLTASISGPASTYVYATGRYTVTVANSGRTTASSSTVVVQLPLTNTSPQVYVMGTLGAKSATCSQVGNTLSCTLGSIRRGRSTSVWFDLALPESAEPLVLTATAATTTAEPTTSNNSASHTASLLNYAVSFSAPVTATNRHCTGTDLSSFFECECFPSSITEHDSTFNADGTVSFGPDIDPGYGGTWSAPTADSLVVTYTYYGGIEAEFEGYGVSSSCWEGLTFFPGSAYMSVYEVCLQ